MSEPLETEEDGYKRVRLSEEDWPAHLQSAERQIAFKPAAAGENLEIWGWCWADESPTFGPF